MPFLRSALDSDKEPIFRLYGEVFREHIDQIWGWNDEWQRNNFRSDWEHTRTEVIECDGDMAGYLQTQCRSSPDHLYVLGLAISRENQSRGIGSRVMKELMQRATDRHVPIRLNVFRTNPAALRFYLRLGFEQEVSTESGVILRWQGPWCP